MHDESLPVRACAMACPDQAEGLRRAMMARVAALAARRRPSSHAATRALRVAVLASEQALSRRVVEQFAQAALPSTTSIGRALRCLSVNADPSAPLSASVQTADCLLLVLDASEPALVASMTWAYALLRHWQASEARPGATQALAAKTRLLLHAADQPEQAQRALHNLHATARRYLGLALPTATCWHAATPSAIAHLVIDLLQGPQPQNTETTP